MRLTRTKSIIVVMAMIATASLASTVAASASTSVGGAVPVAVPSTTGVIVSSGPGWTIVGSGGRTSAQPSAGTVTPMTVTNCGYITCSIYFSRSDTNQMEYQILLYGGGIASLAILCGLTALGTAPVSVVTGVGCAVLVTMGGAFLLNAIQHAAADNGCLRIRGPIPFGFYDDHSSYCTN